MLLVRIPIQLNRPGKTDETLAEIDAALPAIKDPKIARDLTHLKLMTLLANRKLSEQTMPLVEEFIRQDPKDPRGAELLNRLGWSSTNLTAQAEIFRRLITQYPDSDVSKIVVGRLGLLDRIGKPFELEFIDAIGGSPVSIKAMRGKVVVIDFWATWCRPCVAEMPRLKKLHAEYKDRGVEFIGVSLDFAREEGGFDKLKAFVASNEIAWPQYYQGDGAESAVLSGPGHPVDSPALPDRRRRPSRPHRRPKRPGKADPRVSREGQGRRHCSMNREGKGTSTLRGKLRGFKGTSRLLSGLWRVWVIHLTQVEGRANQTGTSRLAGGVWAGWGIRGYRSIWARLSPRIGPGYTGGGHDFLISPGFPANDPDRPSELLQPSPPGLRCRS